MDYDRTTMPAAYDAGRGYSPELLEFWLRTIASAVRGTEINAILDLGCGTGRYSAGLAAQFNAPVVAVDPSEKMLAEAGKKPADGVRFAIGSAEVIPLEDAAVDMVFMSMVFHHFENPRKAAQECHRVLRPGGVVVLRNGTTDQVAGYPYTPFFARAAPLFTASLTSKVFIMESFEAEGFQPVHYELVRSQSAPNWSAYADKIAHRVDSILVRLTDEEFKQGLAVLRDHAAKAPTAEPVIEPIDLFVFRRP